MQYTTARTTHCSYSEAATNKPAQAKHVQICHILFDTAIPIANTSQVHLLCNGNCLPQYVQNLCFCDLQYSQTVLPIYGGDAGHSGANLPLACGNFPWGAKSIPCCMCFSPFIFGPTSWSFDASLLPLHGPEMLFPDIRVVALRGFMSLAVLAISSEVLPVDAFRGFMYTPRSYSGTSPGDASLGFLWVGDLLLACKSCRLRPEHTAKVPCVRHVTDGAS